MSKSNSKRDYYEVLGVSKNATASEIKKAFRQRAMELHPDRNKNTNAEEEFKELNEAYEILYDEEKRKVYDQFGHDGFSNERGSYGGQSPFGDFASAGGFEDIFSNFFSGFGGGRARQRNATHQERGEDLHSELRVSFLDTVLGAERTITLDKWSLCIRCHGNGSKNGKSIKTCSKCNGQGVTTTIRRTILGQIQQQEMCRHCNGQGREVEIPCETCRSKGYTKEVKTVDVKIPAGIQSGQSIIVRGFGKPGFNGGPVGDLYIEIISIEHKHFRRNQDDIYVTLPVSVFDAINQSEIEIPTPYGKVPTKLKANLVSGDQIIIKNHGVQSLRTNRKGNLYAVVKLYVPAKMSGKQAKQIYDLSQGIDDKTYKNFLNDFNY